MTNRQLLLIKYAGLFAVTLFLFFAYATNFTRADIVSGPANAPVCLNGYAGTQYEFWYQGAVPQGVITGTASINFGGTSYATGPQTTYYVERSYTWDTPGTYWAYGIGPSHYWTPTWCGNTGCPGESGGGPGGGTLHGPDGSSAEGTSMSGPAFCKVVITEAPVIQPPDLTAGSITPTSATVGVPVTLSATIANTGTGSTVTGFTDLFQRATSAGGANATDIGTYSNPVRGPSTSNAATVSHTFPSAGTWYVRACADKSSASNTGTISESNESNNCTTSWTAITVTNPALTASCSVSPSSIAEEGSATWTASASGGTGAYTYSWSGTDSLSGTSASVNKQYTTPGTKTASVTVTSGGVSITPSCGNLTVTTPSCPAGQSWDGNSCENVNNGSLSCSVSDSSVNVGDSVTYTASGGSAPYTWNPSDGVGSYGTGSTAQRTFTGTGNFGMTVSKSTYTSGNCPVVAVGTPSCGDASASISASPTRVRENGTATISWSASGVDGTCTITENGTTIETATPALNSCSILPDSDDRTITTQTVYRISCDGGEDTAEVVVNLIPEFEEF